jgi:hypothetical protein
MLSAKQFASGEGRLADVKGERCDFAVVGARKCSAAGGSPSGSRAILGGAGFAIVLGVTIMATRRRGNHMAIALDCCAVNDKQILSTGATNGGCLGPHQGGGRERSDGGHIRL